MIKGLKKFGRELGYRRIPPQGLQHMRDSLMDDSDLDPDYIVLTIGACIIATLGLLSNSAAVIIGAMLVAPLMLPIRGVAYGILDGDPELL
ncbi:MAG: TIGR00341 family protein, partial [Cyanobacteria bacterium J06632_22]